MMSDIAGFFEAVNSRIGCFSFVAVTTVGGIENIVDNLKSEAYPVAKGSDVLQLGFRRTAKIRTDPHTGADQSPRLRSMDRLQLTLVCRRGFRLNIEHLACDHPAATTGCTAKSCHHLQHAVG